MKRKITLLVLVSVALIITMIAGFQLLLPQSRADEAAVSAANNLYETGHYTEAVQIYKQLIDQGYRDSALFYNLGNTYFQQKDYARAILNYRRASLLEPRDRHIQDNLNLAQEMANLEIPAIAPGPLTVVGDLTGRWLNLNETAILAIGLWFITGTFFFSWRLFSNEKSASALRNGGIGVASLLLLVLLSLGGRLLIEKNNPEGIVVAPVVALRSEPGDQYATGVEIKAGAPVGLLEQRGDWIHLSGPGDSFNGWVPASSIETVASSPAHIDFNI
jgi:tetratricopeptide (TPR) repeat protein